MTEVLDAPGRFCLSPEQVAEMSIVAFSGRKHSGKSTMGKYVVQRYGFTPEAMARHLKTEGIAFHGLPAHEVWGPFKSPETREWMEEKGHGDRLRLGMDIWLRTAAANLYFAHEHGARRIVLTDIRYPNEVEWVQNTLGGKVYRITGRGETEGGSPPERALDGYTGFAGYLNNRPGREADVFNDLRDLLEHDFDIVRR